MAAVKLTNALVRNTEPAAGKRLELSDQTVTGLGIRITATGSRSWFVRYRTPAGQKRRKFGTFPALSIAQARQEAKAILASIGKGARRHRKTVIERATARAPKIDRALSRNVASLVACIDEGRRGARLNGTRGVAIY